MRLLTEYWPRLPQISPYWSCQAIATLWRTLRISELLQTIHLILLRILKWCGIALTTTIGVTVIVHIGYWGLLKLLEIYNESRVRRLEDKQQNKERKRRAEYLSELYDVQAQSFVSPPFSAHVFWSDMAVRQNFGPVPSYARQAAEAATMKEARLRRAREDQAIKDKLRRDEEKRRIQARADYVNWEKEYDTVFRDKSSMTKFPFPPLPRYTNTDCPRFLKIPVAAY
ncbi:hypothetical protein BKA61DRAFT_577698 [Leptodontidium sp. MPI-SDFR-AT-0119]|nr:hypothetical protein BKA61DRAFT_577698 [Leptodontidium sp. MPI-SDFR-AT-0119]